MVRNTINKGDSHCKIMESGILNSVHSNILSTLVLCSNSIQAPPQDRGYAIQTTVC
jgi:hypothetical protein